MAKYNNIVLYCTNWGDKEELFASMRSLEQSNPSAQVVVFATTPDKDIQLPIKCELITVDDVPDLIKANPKLIRLYAFDMVKTVADKIIYLDNDTIIMSDIMHLFDTTDMLTATYHGSMFCDSVMVIDLVKFYETIKNASLWDMFAAKCKKKSYHKDDEWFLNEIFTATEIPYKYNTRAKDHRRLIPNTVIILHYPFVKPWSIDVEKQYSYHSLNTILSFYDTDSEKYKTAKVTLDKMKVIFDILKSFGQ